eukprot:3332011-Rhodomonas_salina.1
MQRPCNGADARVRCQVEMAVQKGQEALEAAGQAMQKSAAGSQLFSQISQAVADLAHRETPR